MVLDTLETMIPKVYDELIQLFGTLKFDKAIQQLKILDEEKKARYGETILQSLKIKKAQQIRIIERACEYISDILLSYVSDANRSTTKEAALRLLNEGWRRYRICGKDIGTLINQFCTATDYVPSTSDCESAIRKLFPYVERMGGVNGLCETVKTLSCLTRIKANLEEYVQETTYFLDNNPTSSSLENRLEIMKEVYNGTSIKLKIGKIVNATIRYEKEEARRNREEQDEEEEEEEEARRNREKQEEEEYAQIEEERRRQDE